jgi:RimJ/RimL family protein N-acetyltransferase
VIEPQRLLLRRMDLDDLDEFATLHADPEVTKFVFALDRRESEERLHKDRDEWGQRGHGLLAVVDRTSGDFLGRCGLKFWPQFGETEVGWILRRDAWGSGYATEAARGCIEWGFEQFELPYLTAMINPANERSVRVADRLGMSASREDELLGNPVVVYTIGRPTSD